MWKFKTYLFLVALSLPLWLVAGAEELRPLKAVYFDNYAPFSWIESDPTAPGVKRMQGIFIDVLNEIIVKRLGLSLEHTGYPWERAQRLVREGEADIMITVPTPERAEYSNISAEPVIHSTVTLFVNSQSPRMESLKKVKKLSELMPFQIVTYQGSGWAKKNLIGMRVDWSPTADTVLFKLSRGRGDVFVDTSQVIRYNVKRLNLRDKIVEIPNQLDATTFNFCFSKKSNYPDKEAFIKKLEQQLKAMKADGSYQQILDKYN